MDREITTVWLINPSALPPEREVRLQTLKRAEYLGKKGYNVKIFAGSFLHNTEINLCGPNETEHVLQLSTNVAMVFLRSRKYVGNSLERIISQLEFYIRLVLFSAKHGRPDFICAHSSIPIGALVWILKIKHNCKLITDVVDLWPESFISYGLVKSGNPMVKIAYAVEKFLLEHSDKIIFSMEGGVDYLRERGLLAGFGGRISRDVVAHISNGVDLSQFDKDSENYNYPYPVNLAPHVRKIVYIGSLRTANAIDLLLEAAIELRSNTNLHFIIFGYGDKASFLRETIAIKQLQNVTLVTDHIEIRYVPSLLLQADVLVLNYMKTDIFRFGGSQSKLFQYMASGKPICSNVKMSYCQITRNQIGVSREFKDASEYASCISMLANLSEAELQAIRERARIAVREYDYNCLGERFINFALK